jgi:hypothetical protein
VWHLRPQRSFDYPSGQQSRVHVGHVLDEKLTTPGHDDMRLDNLRRRRAERRGGGGFHIPGRLEKVSLQDQGLMPGAGQQQRGEQSCGTASGNGDIQGVPLPAPHRPSGGGDTRVKRQRPRPIEQE